MPVVNLNRSLKTSHKIYAHLNSRERKKQGKQTACVPQITDILVPQGVGGTPGYENSSDRYMV